MIANRIHLAGDARHLEGACGAALYPGMLVKINSSGVVIPHATAGGKPELMFAEEDALQGNTTATAYSAGSGTYGESDYVGPDRVRYLIGVPGTEVNALLDAGYAYVVGEKLISAGDGTLKPASSADSAAMSDNPIAVVMALQGGDADEAIDLSGSGAVDTLHPVRLL